MSNANAKAHDAIRIFDAVCVLRRNTGFRTTTAQINVLRRWIAEGERDVALMADALTYC